MTEIDFNSSVPVRNVSNWKSTEPTYIICSCTNHHLLDGEIGTALLPNELLFSEIERNETLKKLKSRQVKQYENTNASQKVMVDGFPFVDSTSYNEYLHAEMDAEFIELVRKPINNLKKHFESLGIKTEILFDEVTGLPFKAGVFRTISVPKASVLHVDDLGRDGFLKPDFRMPKALQGVYYNQVSFNVLLDDGGYEPDSLYVYNQPYKKEHEELVYVNGWQFPQWLVQDSQYIKYTPKVGQAYAFSTTNYHDVNGGHPLAHRVTFSVFGIWVRELNTLYLYN